MAYPPLPIRPSPPEPGVLLQRRPANPDPVSKEPDAEALLDALRTSIASGKHELDVLLGAIAEVAQILTRASASAIALRRGGVVVCLGRSGEAAPQLGSRLSMDSGVSGECLRTGKILRCDDTGKDQRADPVVCHRLGLRSIAAVPVRGRRGTIGVLEAFSTRPYAFPDEHVAFLARLAELAGAADARELLAENSVADIGPTPSKTRLVSSASLRAKQTVAGAWRNSWRSAVKRRYWVMGTASAVLLISLAAWWGWSNPEADAVSSQAQAQSQILPAESTSAAIGAELTWKPSPAHPPSDSSVPGTNRSVLPAAKLDIERLSLPENLLQRTPAPASAMPATNSQSSSVDEGSLQVEAPPLVAVGSDQASLGTMLSAPVAMPEFAVPVSQGVSDGYLLQKVQPVYPVQARPLRLEGAVVLQATIAEDGRIQELRVVSGNRILANAALDAVKRWDYRPYQLNGKPVRMQTEITVTFKLQ
jgi:protein TonB